MDKKMKKFLLVCILIATLILVIWTIFFVSKLIISKKVKNSNEDLYNKELYVSATLPNIVGNTNSLYDDYGRKLNVSSDIKNEKKWMNLTFSDFEIYSMSGKTSVIKFTISNNNNMIVESNKFQLQLKNDNSEVVAIINFESLVIPSTGKVNVTVDVTGDIANVKDIAIDDVNYTMQVQEVK